MCLARLETTFHSLNNLPTERVKGVRCVRIAKQTLQRSFTGATSQIKINVMLE